ncbi:hypothetical protein BH23ACT12_BH23ACT12_15940 [soil metagenome]
MGSVTESAVLSMTVLGLACLLNAALIYLVISKLVAWIHRVGESRRSGNGSP